jgi:hypothetical protein
MTVDLNTCVPGQSVKRGDGETLIYAKHFPEESLYRHALCDLIENEVVYFMDDGKYYKPLPKSLCNIVKILPLDKLEPPKSDTHPSIAWWESCPWITDRQPTKEDGDSLGHVYVINDDYKRILTIGWSSVQETMPWLHTCTWQPPTLTNKAKALELLNKHKDSVTMCVWIPTSDDWNVIRKGLEE